MNITAPRTFTLQTKYILLAALMLIAAALLYTALPDQGDWVYYYRPATLAMIHGKSPYSVHCFHNAPWTLLPFIPLALLPENLGKFGLYLLGLSCYVYIATRLSGNLTSTVLFLTSVPVLTSLDGAGIDWLPMLSLVTPPAVSLVFAAMKPQIGLGVAIYWLLLAWELGQIRLIARWFAPALFMLAASLLAYGFWPLTFIGKSENPANVAAFPYLIPLGLYMLWTRRADASKASGIFFAPYHTLYSAVLPLTVLFKHPRLMFIAWLILWAYQLFEVMVK